jgi:hypothetical protein
MTGGATGGTTSTGGSSGTGGGCKDITSQQTSFNAFNDFSFQSNPVPGGAWQYGDEATMGGAFNLYTAKGTNYSQTSGLSNLSCWIVAPGQVDPNVIKNETGTDMTSNTGAWVFIPATVYLHMHPGPSGQYTVVRWICPADGIYQLDSAFRSLRTGGSATTTDVHVLLNNSPIFNGAINGFYADGDIPYAATLPLKACDKLDFEVGFGSNQNYLYDSTGLRASIQKN